MKSPTSISNDLKSKTQVTICEEYGYRWWIWEFPGTTDQLRTYWNNEVMTNVEKAGCLFRPQNLKGKLKKASVDNHIQPTVFMIDDELITRDQEKENFCHIHETEDSYLKIKT
jgi:hypothetical protein